jgi:hypothetical protein
MPRDWEFEGGAYGSLFLSVPVYQRHPDQTEPLATMAQRFDHGSLILAVRACYNDDATDLLAVAGDHSVDVLQLVCISLLGDSSHWTSTVTRSSHANRVLSYWIKGHYFGLVAQNGFSLFQRPMAPRVGRNAATYWVIQSISLGSQPPAPTIASIS